MVSLLQDQSNIKFSSSDTLERDQQDLMKTQGDSVSPIQQTVSKTTPFCSLSTEAQVQMQYLSIVVLNLSILNW